MPQILKTCEFDVEAGQSRVELEINAPPAIGRAALRPSWLDLPPHHHRELRNGNSLHEAPSK